VDVCAGYGMRDPGKVLLDVTLTVFRRQALPNFG
jgi:hypothetical protein